MKSATFKNFYRSPRGEEKSGRPVVSNIEETIENIYLYLQENMDECQFSSYDLKNQIEVDFRSHLKTVKSKLLKKYVDDIDIAVTSPVVRFRNTGYIVLSDKFYENRKLDPKEERLRIV